MKVLITSEWYAPVINGVVTSILNLEKELLKLGHEVRVLTLSPNRHSYREGHVSFIASLNASWVYPNARLTLAPRNRLIKELIAWCPDIIHTQAEFSTFLMARHIGKVCKAPLIHTYHTVYEDYTHYFFPNKKIGKSIAVGLSRFILKRTQRVIAPTSKVSRMLDSYKVHVPIEVVPTGIELEQFTATQDPNKLAQIKTDLQIDPSNMVLLYLGRLAKEKNVEEILQFVKDLADDQLIFLIVGGGPYLKTLESHTANLGITERVRFAGMIKPTDVPTYYALADLFVSASQSETQGLTYIEALAAGLPALCKEDACLEGVITNDENGWQYLQETEFKEHLATFRADAGRRAEMAANARRDALAKFSAESFGEQVAALYTKTLEEAQVKRKA